MAVENRLPEPAAIEDALQPPLAAVWGAPVAMLRDFASQPAAEGNALAGALDGLLKSVDDCPF